MATLDRLVLLTTILFAIAALLVLISISRPRWILSVNHGNEQRVSAKRRTAFSCTGETSLGLIEMCISSSSHSKNENCFIPHHIRPVWIVSFGLAIGAVGLLALSVLLLIASQYVRATTVEYGRLAGFVASESGWYVVTKQKRNNRCADYSSDLSMPLDDSFSDGLRFGNHRRFTVSITCWFSHWLKLHCFRWGHLVNSSFGTCHRKNVFTEIRYLMDQRHCILMFFPLSLLTECLNIDRSRYFRSRWRSISAQLVGHCRHRWSIDRPIPSSLWSNKQSAKIWHVSPFQ